MNLTALKSWVSGETLTAADLNAEFQNIYTHTIDNNDMDSTASYVLGELVIGTGLAAADGGQLHVHTGSAGTVQAASDADEAVFENSTASGVTILSGLTSTGKVAFGDSGDNDIGLITYNHATDAMTLTTNGTTALTLSSAQAATFAGDVTVGGALTLTGGITLNGNTTIGDSSADTLTVNSTITSNLIFTDNTYDIGASGATRPRDLFLSRNAVMGGTLGVTGATTLSSTLGVTGALTATAGITSGSNIVSDSDSTDDLGTTSVRWANLYVDSIGDTGQALAITAGSNNINVTAGTLALTGAQTISSTLGVTGLITATGGVTGNVTGGTISATTGSFSSTLGVTGATTLSSDVGIGTSATATNRLTLSGNQVILASGELKLADAANAQVGTIKNANSNGSQLDFITGGSTAMTIDSSQRVGIGTNLPSHELAVVSTSSGPVVEVESTAVNGNPSFRLKNDAQEWQWQLRGAESDSLVAWDVTGAAGRLYLTTDGKLCINRTSGNTALNIDPHTTGSPNIQLYNKTNDAYTYLKNDGSAFVIQNSYGTTAGFKPIQFMTNGSVNLHIDEVGGNVGIGTSSPSEKLHVSGSANGLPVNILCANTYYAASSTDESASFQGEFYQNDVSANRAAGYMRFYKEGDFSNNANASAGIIFATRNAGTLGERVRILSSGGITFNGDTATGNALDDYEEGSWTPAFSGFTGSYGNQTGRYVKIGQLVHASCYMTLSSITSMDGAALTVTGLPFAAENSGVWYAGTFGNVGYLDLPTGTVQATWNIGQNLTTSTCRAIKDNANYEDVLNTAITSTSFFMFVSWTYRTT